MDRKYGKAAALASIRGESGSCIRGSVTFYLCGKGVLVDADLFGLPETEWGFFGFHIHQGMSCTGPGFAGTGTHLNSDNDSHPHHAGDLPPLLSCHGRVKQSVLTDRFCLEEVLGKTVVIHRWPDDFCTQPSGNAGEKIACGVIRKL